MGAARVNIALATPTGHVAGTVRLATQKRAAFLDALLDSWLVGVEAVFGAFGVLCRALGKVVRAVPVRAPLPDIARHAVEAKGIDGCALIMV